MLKIIYIIMVILMNGRPQMLYTVLIKLSQRKFQMEVLMRAGVLFTLHGIGPTKFLLGSQWISDLSFSRISHFFCRMLHEEA